MEQFIVTPVDEPKKTVSKKMILILAMAIALLVVSIGAVVYLAFQASAHSSKLGQLEADKAKLANDFTKYKLDQAANVAGDQAAANAPKRADDVNQVLTRIYEHDKADLTSGDKAMALEVARKYYKATAIPDGASVLIGYKIDTTKSDGQVRALVYWPGKEGERPEFLDVIKDTDTPAWHVGTSD